MIAKCPHCQKKLEIEDQLSGKQAACPACQKVFTVPVLPTGSTKAARADSPAATPPAPPPPPPPPPPPIKPKAARPAAVPPPPMPTTAKVPAAGPVVPPPPPPAPPAPTEPFWSRLKRIFRAGTKRIKQQTLMLKLKQDVGNLHKALDQQMQALYGLTVQHRPESVDISAELNNMSQVQIQLNDKQTTLSSLQQTKGSGTVTKDLKREIATLQEQQKQIMIDIGVKTDSARPDMPGAAGNYGAIDRLRTGLQEKEGELQRLGAEIGPITEAGDLGSMGRSAKRYLPHAAIAVVGVVVLYLLVGWLGGALFGGGGLGDWAVYVPKDARGIVYLHFEKLRERDSKVFDSLGESLGKAMTQQNNPALKIDPDELVECLLVYPAKTGQFVGVFRTAGDRELKDLVRNYDSKNVESYKDIEYVRAGPVYNSLYLAKSDDRTFCFSMQEDALKDTLAQVARQEKPELSDGLQEALEYASREDHFVVMDMKNGSALPGLNEMSQEMGQGEAIGIGMSVGSNVEARAIVIFRDADDAADAEEKLEDELDKGIEQMEKGIDKAPAGAIKDQMETGLKMMKKLDVDRGGRGLRLTWKFDTDDVEDLLGDVVEDFGGSLFGMPFFGM